MRGECRESRLAKVSLSEDDYESLDSLADEITEQVEDETARKARSRWARLEAIVGAEDRLDLIAKDIVDHWEKRREAMIGKARADRRDSWRGPGRRG